jgi:hypothetical protein
MRKLLPVVVAFLLAPGMAAAHDALAPPGSDPVWLPAEKWVESHWVPFDEQALKAALGLRGRQLEAYLYDDHHTLAELARRRGIAPDQLADRLIDPWRATSSPERLERLRDHTLRTLTQGHLAQHVFFHVFHGLPVAQNAPALFGMSSADYLRLRARGLRPLRIAHRGGKTYRSVRDGMVALFAAARDEGIRDRLAWASQSYRIFDRQVRALPCWLRRPDPPRDPGNPYGKARQLHGRHGHGWPATERERRANERRAERIRRSLHSSCWSPPPPWSWAHVHPAI